MTHEKLRKREIIMVTLLCGDAAETVEHLFLHCRITDQLWKIFIYLRGIYWTMPSKIIDTLSSWEEDGIGARNRSDWRIIPACIWWTLWKGIPDVLRIEVVAYMKLSFSKKKK